MSAVTGDFRASVMLSRHMLKCATFSAWSVHELAFLFFVHCGVPAQYHLAPTQRWMDCLCLWSNQMVADKLREMSGTSYTAAAVTHAFAAFKSFCQASQGAHRSKFVLGSLVWTLPSEIVRGSESDVNVDLSPDGDDAGATAAHEVSQLLRDTTVLREAHNKSRRQFNITEGMLSKRFESRPRLLGAPCCSFRVPGETVSCVRDG